MNMTKYIDKIVFEVSMIFKSMVAIKKMIFKNMVQYLLKKFIILEYGLVCALTSNNFVVKQV